jgi:GT2 family glycosyltransferase
MLTLVCASQHMPEHFARATLLGRSLRQFPKQLKPRLFLVAGNRGSHCRGLAEVYNQAIEELPSEGMVAFVHDDLFIHDWFLGFRLQQALRHFDLVGIAGEGEAGPHQGNWYFEQVEERWQWAQRRPSGYLNHWDPSRVEPSDYGPTPRRCMVLDGVLLALRLSVLRSTGLRFDPQFRFHAYDIDFCRSALTLGLSLGTWPIACTHGSGGSHDQRWREEVARYQAKWADRPWPPAPADDLPEELL